MLKFMLLRKQKLHFVIDKMHVGYVIHLVRNRDKKEMLNGSMQLMTNLNVILMFFPLSFLI